MERRLESDRARDEPRRAATPRRSVAVDPAAALVLQLQAQAGNAAVQRLVHRSVTVQRFWPFDDEEEPGEDAFEAEDSGSIPNEAWGGDEATGEDASGEAPAGDGGGGGSWDDAEGWIGPGGDWGAADESAEGEPQADGTGGQDWIGPGGDGSADDAGATGETEFLTGSPEEQWNEAVEDGDFDEALAIVLRTYGFGGKYVYDIWVNPNESSAAMAGGPLGSPQWISVGYDAFNGGWAWCVSVIGHEMEHAKQRAGDLEYHGPGDDPDEGKAPGDRGRPLEDAALREFLAYSWEVLDSPVKPENDDMYRMCDEAIYAFAFIGLAQSFYQERKDRVVAVRRTLSVPEAYQKPAKTYG